MGGLLARCKYGNATFNKSRKQPPRQNIPPGVEYNVYSRGNKAPNTSSLVMEAHEATTSVSESKSVWEQRLRSHVFNCEEMKNKLDGERKRIRSAMHTSKSDKGRRKVALERERMEASERAGRVERAEAEEIARVKQSLLFLGAEKAADIAVGSKESSKTTLYTKAKSQTSFSKSETAIYYSDAVEEPDYYTSDTAKGK